jgi:hypothetical protein
MENKKQASKVLTLVEYLDAIGCDRAYSKDMKGTYKNDLALLQAQVKKCSQSTYCAYCGQEYPIDVDGEIIAEHIATCPKHPMQKMRAIYEEKIKVLEEQLASK